jgi:hypothetical protein
LPWLICKASKTHMDWWFKDVYTTHKKMLSNWGWSILLPHIDLNIIVWYSYINILLDIMIEKLNFYTYLYINIYELLILVEYSDCFPVDSDRKSTSPSQVALSWPPQWCETQRQICPKNHRDEMGCRWDNC